MSSHEYSLSAAKEEVDIRLIIQHEVFVKTIDGHLLNAPVAKPIGRVLDIGTGSGLWAAELATENPTAEIVGIDNYPQPQIAAPSNCHFIAMDAEQDWKKIGGDDGDTLFDVMHTRLVPFHIKEVPGVLHRCYKHLKPRGYIEMQELWPPLRTDEPPGAPEHASKVIEWTRLRLEAASKLGVDQNMASQLPEALSKAGFVDVQVQDHKIPVGPWMEDEKMKDLGSMFLELLQLSKMVSSEHLLTHLGMGEQEIIDLVEQASKELGVGKIYAMARFVWARKPE